MPILVFNGFSGLASGPISFSLGLFQHHQMIILGICTRGIIISAIKISDYFCDVIVFYDMPFLDIMTYICDSCTEIP